MTLREARAAARAVEDLAVRRLRRVSIAFLLAAIVSGWYHLYVVQFPLGLVGLLLLLAAERRKRLVKRQRTTEEEWKATFPPP
jgi:hypothetical protein